MQTSVVDYLGSLLAGEGSIRCKFIVVAHSGTLYFVFGPVSVYPYHANLLGRFCQERDIGYRWIKVPDVVKIQEPEYRILGGGHLEIDPTKRRVQLSGSSKAYGHFALEDIKLITSREPFFAQYSVQIKS